MLSEYSAYAHRFMSSNKRAKQTLIITIMVPIMDTPENSKCPANAEMILIHNNTL